MAMFAWEARSRPPSPASSQVSYDARIVGGYGEKGISTPLRQSLFSKIDSTNCFINDSFDGVLVGIIIIRGK